MTKNSELEAKIAALQEQFNARITEEHGSRLVKKYDNVHNKRDFNPVDGRYDDQFYNDMSEYYMNYKRHDSPNKRLVKQKNDTVKAKTADPNRIHTNLYINEKTLGKTLNKK